MFAPRKHSGAALSRFLGLVYGPVVPDDGVPGNVAWNGRRAALANLVSFVRARDQKHAWPTFIAEHKDQSLRLKGSDPRRRSQDSLEEFLCEIQLLDMGDPRLEGHEGARDGACDAADRSEGPEAGPVGPPFRFVPPASPDDVPLPPASPTSDSRGADLTGGSELGEPARHGGTMGRMSPAPRQWTAAANTTRRRKSSGPALRMAAR